MRSRSPSTAGSPRPATNQCKVGSTVNQTVPLEEAEILELLKKLASNDYRDVENASKWLNKDTKNRCKVNSIN